MNQEQLRALGRLLHERRIKLKMTSPQLGHAAAMHHSTILRIEAGKFAALSLNTVARLSELLGCRMGDLFLDSGYFTKDDLPDFKEYLSARFPDVPKAVIRDLLLMCNLWIERNGVVQSTKTPKIWDIKRPEHRSSLEVDLKTAEARPEARSLFTRGRKPTQEERNDYAGGTP